MNDLFGATAVAANPQPETLPIIHRAEVLGKQFQIYGTTEDPLFLAKDVAAWIEHSNHRVMLDSIDEDEKHKFAAPVNNPYSPRQTEEQWFLTEAGLYEVLMLSRKPIAKAFKKQVKKILHEIRTTGGYVHAGPDEPVEVLMARALKAADAAIQRQKARLAETERQLVAQAPAVDYCNNVLSSENLHTVNSIAVHLGVSAIRLNKFLMDHGFIYRQGDIYYPSFKIRDKGYCDFHVVPYINRQGEKMTREHLKWTEAGRKFVIDSYNKFIRKEA